jgi:hypothetical protein
MIRQRRESFKLQRWLFTQEAESHKIVNRMAEILNIDEIKSRYDGEWVLIGDPVTDDSPMVVRGSVLWHSKDRDEVYCKARELKPVHSAILFFGHLPKDAAIVL